MPKRSRSIAAALIAVTMSLSATPIADAQTDDVHEPSDLQSPGTEQQATDSAIEASRTPSAGREDLDPQQPGFNDNNVDNQAAIGWHATENPQSTISPGEMRSDSEEIPGGFTKEEADRAEIQEAQERASRSGADEGRQSRIAAAPANCTTYWPSPYRVCGAIREKYESIGGPTSFLTFPKSDELGVPDGVGRRNEFVNGFIYWHPDTGAQPVTTHFSVVWARNGWEAGRLGYPTSDPGPSQDGWYEQTFENSDIIGNIAGDPFDGGFSLPYIYFPDAQAADNYYNHRVPLAEAQGESEATARQSRSPIKEYGPCVLDPRKIHIRTDSGPQKAVGLKPKTTCKVGSSLVTASKIDHYSRLVYEYYTQWNDAADNRAVAYNVSSMESKKLVEICDGDVSTLFWGSARGQIIYNNKNYFANTKPPKEKLDCRAH